MICFIRPIYSGKLIKCKIGRPKRKEKKHTIRIMGGLHLGSLFTVIRFVAQCLFCLIVAYSSDGKEKQA